MWTRLSSSKTFYLWIEGSVNFIKDLLKWIGWGKIFFGEHKWSYFFIVDILLATSKFILAFFRIILGFLHFYGNWRSSLTIPVIFGWFKTVFELEILSLGKDWEKEAYVLIFRLLSLWFIDILGFNKFNN